MYCSLACIYAVKVLMVYLEKTYLPLECSFHSICSYLPPGVIYNYFSSDIPVSFTTCACIFILWGTFTTGFGTTMFFIFQVMLVLRGQTPHEWQQNNFDFNFGYVKNIEVVFGKWWFVYFIIPFPQRFMGEKAVWGKPSHVENV